MPVSHRAAACPARETTFSPRLAARQECETPNDLREDDPGPVDSPFHGHGLLRRHMTDTVENLILDLVEWVERSERTYAETMDAWRTSCPRLPVWEDASERGLVERSVANGCVIVRATSAGLALLERRRPHIYEDLQRRG